MNSSDLFIDGGSYNYVPLNSKRTLKLGDVRGDLSVTLCLSGLGFWGRDGRCWADGLCSTQGRRGVRRDARVPFPASRPWEPLTQRAPAASVCAVVRDAAGGGSG